MTSEGNHEPPVLKRCKEVPRMKLALSKSLAGRPEFSFVAVVLGQRMPPLCAPASSVLQGEISPLLYDGAVRNN